MATQRSTATKQTYNRTNDRITYLYGSTAMQTAPLPKITPQQDEVRREAGKEQVGTRARRRSMSLPLGLLAAVTFAMIGYLMVQYISLNSQISVLSGSIASLENQINDLRDENDEYRSRIDSSVDIEKVREVALVDLGMTYATKDQIVTYDSQVDDYVEQSRVVKGE